MSPMTIKIKLKLKSVVQEVPILYQTNINKEK